MWTHNYTYNTHMCVCTPSLPITHSHTHTHTHTRQCVQMAVEKLAQGIEAFCVDQRKLEEMLAKAAEAQGIKL